MLLGDCHERIKNVQRGYKAALSTAEALIEIAKRDPRCLQENDLTPKKLRSLLDEFHDLYFVRIFACFESIVRDYWRTLRNTKPSTERLLSAVAGRRSIPKDTLDTVHEIREFRNYLIHGERRQGPSFTIDEAGKHLNTFLARLPPRW